MHNRVMKGHGLQQLLGDPPSINLNCHAFGHEDLGGLTIMVDSAHLPHLKGLARQCSLLAVHAAAAAVLAA